MALQAYKVVRTHANKISVWKILSRLLHSRAPHIVGMNDDVKYDLDTLAFNNEEQLEDFHNRILRLQQEILISGDSVSPTRVLFWYTMEFSKIDTFKSLIAPNITDLNTVLDNNRKLMHRQE